VAYWLQLKGRVKISGKMLEYAAAMEQLTHWALVGFPVAFIQTEATRTFIEGVQDWEVKQHLWMGGDRTWNEALKLDAAKVAARPPARLWELSRVLARASQPLDC
jgi:hypothetical protein